MEVMMMIDEFEKMEKAKTVLLKIAKGIDPLTGEAIAETNFLNDPRLIRCFYFITEVLDDVIQGVYRKTRSHLPDFIITPEQKQRVTFPEGKIGVNEFSRQINQSIDINTSKKLTGVELNKKLKKMGILAEKNLENGKTRTVTNSNSAKYGFEMENRKFNGVEYEMVVINDQGKKYLLDNIETIMKSEE
jgi:hypothetical protein